MFYVKNERHQVKCVTKVKQFIRNTRVDAGNDMAKLMKCNAVFLVQHKLCQRTLKSLKIAFVAVFALSVFTYVNLNGQRLLPCDTSIQKVDSLRTLIKIVSRALEMHNVTYWIDYGTALGAYRYCDVIPWDHDADIGYLEIDTGKVMKAAEDVNRHDGFEMNHLMATYRSQILDFFPWKRVKNWWSCSSVYNLITGHNDTNENYKMYNVNPRNNPLKLAIVNLIFEHFPVSFINERSRVKFADFEVYTMRNITELVQWRYFLTYDRVVPFFVYCVNNFYNSTGGMNKCAEQQ